MAADSFQERTVYPSYAPDTIDLFAELAPAEQPSVLLIVDEGYDSVAGVIADALGQPWALATSIEDVSSQERRVVVGMFRTAEYAENDLRSLSRLVINTRCVDGDRSRASASSDGDWCDFEYIYSTTSYLRRDIARFLSFVLGLSHHHRSLREKERTTLLSTTYPDVQAALPNLDILSVGADAVEFRVDLLEEQLADGTFAPVPGVDYVGEQLMILRQRTELPIIYTTRCTRENGRFPMEDPELFYKYLFKAIQWGCEFIDVELWLPEELRRELSKKKGNSRIISAFHDFSGNFKWGSAEAESLFQKGVVFGDIVKMIALVHNMQDNYELENFRSKIRTKYNFPYLSGLNMGPAGQLSRTLNRVFTPITHPLLPFTAAPGQLSAAEINGALHTMGLMPRLDIYGVGNFRSATQVTFFEKCFNELSLPHQFIHFERMPQGTLETLLPRSRFGGVHINPPISASAAQVSSLTEAALAIGQVDTVKVCGEGVALGCNATWKGIQATLTRDFVATAYKGRAAFVLAAAESDAAPAIFALKKVGIGPIYTVGFKTVGPLAGGVQPVRAVEDLKSLEHPFVIVSALPSDRSSLVGPLLKHYGASVQESRTRVGKVFVDLGEGPRRSNAMSIAQSLGWTAYDVADVSAWTTVQTFRLLVGQNVPYDFVRLTSG
ncbi:aldolase [Aulographum hederae CBS 113979]|uniref:Aldolase n=1 Tax=Aulographum hederae CBS 113979 TaxID=1176131 RepID=A0A6G1HD11_9PEZI|nr:aldolase [Aulographum hederae CBS 113979]